MVLAFSGEVRSGQQVFKVGGGVAPRACLIRENEPHYEIVHLSMGSMTWVPNRARCQRRTTKIGVDVTHGRRRLSLTVERCVLVNSEIPPRINLRAAAVGLFAAALFKPQHR